MQMAAMRRSDSMENNWFEKNGFDPKTRETCFNCNHKFNDTDAVYLGLLDGHKNEIFCEKCAKEISESI